MGMTDWQTIVDQQGPRVWRTAYRLVGNAADASDCVQEAFVSALAYSREHTVRDWSGLMVRLATHRALDLLRRRRRDGCCVALEDWSGVGACLSDPTLAAEQGELAGRLRLALAQLPARQAEVFCLRTLQELSYRQIAAQLEMSLPSVAVSLHRARHTLRHLLKGVAEHESPRVKP